MSYVNEINQIYCDSGITVNKVNMTSLLFVDNKVVSKSRYSVVDNFINLLDPAEKTICMYHHTDSSYYYEYYVDLSQPGVELYGPDINGNELKGLNNGELMVFIDGYKLLPSEYTIVYDNETRTYKLIITYQHLRDDNEKSTVIIYVSPSMTYLGEVTKNSTWNFNKHSFVLDDYTYLRYVFFKNGEVITRDKIYKIDDIVTINVDIRDGVDIIEYYRLPIDTQNVLFEAELGYFNYGPEDVSSLLVPEMYDATVTFNKVVRLAIDDVRKGFFIREVDGDGCLMISNEDFETKQAKCISVVDFSNTTYNKEEYFVQVPEARSILKYVSEYDLRGTLFPELLGSFQKLLLNETYDSIQRMKNIRNINKVDSQHINRLINFMGLNINITNLDLRQKHSLLEELTNFYNIVGTRESYNFYNTTTTNGRIVDMEQLFTPIEDIKTGQDPVQRYVTFRTAEELGAETKRRYDYPHYDLGYVNVLAQVTDSFTNQPRSEGVKEDPTLPVILETPRPVNYLRDDGVIVTEWIDTPTNVYTVQPKAGPNQPSSGYDFGTLPKAGEPDNATSFYDFGKVSDVIKGKWVEWTVWDRPTNWYPTNHVNISVQVPADVNYTTFMTEFKNTFYNIASAVLYIHGVVEVYTFGKENPWQTSDADEATGGAAEFDILAAPLYHTVEYTFTNDPARQDYRSN